MSGGGDAPCSGKHHESPEHIDDVEADTAEAKRGSAVSAAGGEMIAPRRNRAGRASAVLLLAAAVALAAAAGDAAAKGKKKKEQPPEEEPELLQLMWPEPPLTPRIKTLQTYSTEAHLGRKPTRRELFKQFIAGVAPPRSHLYQPMDIVVSDDGRRFYVADFGQLVVFVFDLDEKRLTQIGDNHPFDRPFGLALDAEENLWVVEQASRRIVVLNREHDPVQVIEHPSLVRPADVALDRERRLLYVADPATKASEVHSVKVFDLSGNLVREVGNGKGTCEGCLYFPTYVAVDPSGNLYVTSTLNSRVDVFDAEGAYVRHFGERGTSFGMFDKPKGVAVDSFGNVYVVDSGWSNVQIFNQKGEVLLFFGGRGSYPGLLKNPTGIAIDSNNRIYVGDFLNYRINVYELVNTTAEDSYTEPAAEGTSSGDS